MQSPQLETKGQQNKRIAVSPQLETKGRQNRRQNGKQSPQLRAKVIQRKQQNVKQSQQLEFVQSETKSHQIKEMRKQADMQYRQSRNLQIEHQSDNSKHQPQLVDSSCQDSSVATSQAMQYTQSEKVQNQHQLDNNKYQPQVVGTSCLDSSVATSEANYPQSDDILNLHCSGQPYPHLDIRTSQPQQVDTSHQESTTSIEDLDNASNWQDARQSPHGLKKSNQDQTNKPYLQLDIRAYQPQQVNSSCKESSDDPSSGKGPVSAVSKDVMQYLQLETVLYKQQQSKHYLQLNIRTYQPQRVDTSCQESFDDLTSGKELVSAYNKNVIQPPQLDRLQPSKPYPQLDIRLYQLQQVDNSYQESSDVATSGKELDHTLNKIKLCEVYHSLVQLKDKHVEEAAESVVLLKWFFIKCDPQLGILSKMKSHMAGGNLMTIGLKIDPVNLQRMDISERRVTSANPVAMDTCKLDYVGESNLGPKFVIPGVAYHNT